MSPAHPTAASASLSKGAEVDLHIEKLAFGGKALGRVDGFVVFVEHAVPGQTRARADHPEKIALRRSRGCAAPGAVPGLCPALSAPILASAAAANGKISPMRSSCTGKRSTSRNVSSIWPD